MSRRLRRCSQGTNFIERINELELLSNGRDAQTFSNSVSVFRITLVEDLDLPFLEVSLGALEVSDEVVDELVAVGVLHDLAEQRARLGEVAVGVSGLESADVSTNLG